jgi:hypothetical protein
MSSPMVQSYLEQAAQLLGSGNAGGLAEALADAEIKGYGAAKKKAAILAYAEADRQDKLSLPGAACVRVGDAILRLKPSVGG